MKNNNYLCFFSGVGICVNNNTKPIVKVYEKEKAQKLLEELTKTLVSKFKNNTKKELLQKLLDIHKTVNYKNNYTSNIDVNFDKNDIYCNDTRVSFSNKKINWSEIKKILSK